MLSYVQIRTKGHQSHTHLPKVSLFRTGIMTENRFTRCVQASWSRKAWQVTAFSLTTEHRTPPELCQQHSQHRQNYPGSVRGSLLEEGSNWDQKPPWLWPQLLKYSSTAQSASLHYHVSSISNTRVCTKNLKIRVASMVLDQTQSSLHENTFLIKLLYVLFIVSIAKKVFNILFTPWSLVFMQRMDLYFAAPQHINSISKQTENTGFALRLKLDTFISKKQVVLYTVNKLADPSASTRLPPRLVKSYF